MLPFCYLCSFFCLFQISATLFVYFRVGRTARIGEKGEALLFLQPIETDYLRDLELHGASLTEYPLQKVLDSFPVNGQRLQKRKQISLDMHPWIMSLQRALESFVTSEVMYRTPFRSVSWYHIWLLMHNEINSAQI